MGGKHRLVACLLLALLVSGCPTTYRGYRHLQGRVVAADTGVGLPNTQVVACLVDRSPTGRPRDCSSTRWKKEVLTDSEGRFEIQETHHFTLALPFPGGFPTFATDVLVQKEGYEKKEFHWWRDDGLFSQRPWVVQLERAQPLGDGQPQ
jgi:hypothetical protein